MNIIKKYFKRLLTVPQESSQLRW